MSATNNKINGFNIKTQIFNNNLIILLTQITQTKTVKAIEKVTAFPFLITKKKKMTI